MRRPSLLISILAATVFLWACGVSSDDLTAIILSPHNGTAIHGSGTDTVQFQAVGVYQVIGQYSISFTRNLTDAHWTTSDGANTTIDAQGLATCTGHTPVPAIVTASHKGTNGDTISGGAFLTCD